MDRAARLHGFIHRTFEIFLVNIPIFFFRGNFVRNHRSIDAPIERFMKTDTKKKNKHKQKKLLNQLNLLHIPVCHCVSDDNEIV